MKKNYVWQVQFEEAIKGVWRNACGNEMYPAVFKTRSKARIEAQRRVKLNGFAYRVVKHETQD